ncbi:MAG TPA: SNF2-related protein [Arenimonas sp.]|nr:SNF2-related protein [Arenimonas sp.]
MTRDSQQSLNDLFGHAFRSGESSKKNWPEAARFPLNISPKHVKDFIWKDITSSRKSIIVAGYTSLDWLIDLVQESQGSDEIRLLFGSEPFPSRREEYRLIKSDLPDEVMSYWLKRGISLLRSAALIHFINCLKSGKVKARYLRGGTRLHAKIYCGDNAASLGSSNFTRPGLISQHEANARFLRVGAESQRYNELFQIAENYWLLGTDYGEELIALLEQLIKAVSWQEALARASAELLEGEWAEAYLREDYLGDAGKLWPSQKQGIAQALYVLSNEGSVLIADATGAGKTKMGTYLIGAVRDQILRDGRLRQGKSLMICPPSVKDNWVREAHSSGISLDVNSHGELSHEKSRGHELSIAALRKAQLLCIDEGHNFLNFKSNRTQQLLRNMADHVVLLTATPINRGVTDLLRIADMLGADNLAESTLKAFQKMLGVKNLSRSLTESEIDLLRREIQRFTVRRTKRVLNSLIDREPEMYRDKNGRCCRFPLHEPHVYKLNEPEVDRNIAKQIRELCDQLYGVTHFVKPIEMPDVLTKQGVSEERYLSGRLNSAKKLSRYIVMGSLRSSRAALFEHIHGTSAAIDSFNLKGFSKKSETGNQCGALINIRGKIPRNLLSISLPDWLSEEALHHAACEHDHAIYLEIGRLVMLMSEHREVQKAKLLQDLISRHGLILAFDSRPISLALIRQLLLENGISQILLAWGDVSSDRDELLKKFEHGSLERGIIGLCSDSLSEGVNLQQASALVHLDMPSVVRIAEQRVGRVDRMDSPHDAIQAWWPEDAQEFALASDERFIERYETVDRLLGSNMPLPEHLQIESSSPISTATLIAEYENEGAGAWDGIDDAFQPVRDLISGPRALIDSEIYEQYRQVSECVMSRVSLVKSDQPWAFFCLNSGPFGAPRWIFMPSKSAAAIKTLSLVSDGLRSRLGPEIENLPLDYESAGTLRHFLGRLPDVERALLSRKKQRALEEMAHILPKLIEYASSCERQVWLEHLQNISNMLQRKSDDMQPDWDQVASRWLDVIRPKWFERLTGKRNRPLLLKDIRKDLLNDPEWTISNFVQHFTGFNALSNPEERIKACIIGVGSVVPND